MNVFRGMYKKLLSEYSNSGRLINDKIEFF